MSKFNPTIIPTIVVVILTINTVFLVLHGKKKDEIIALQEVLIRQQEILIKTYEIRLSKKE